MVKKAWQHQTHRRASFIFNQMRLAVEALERAGKMTADEFFALENNGYLAKLDELYTEDFQLARLLDESDLILHAEGPAVSQRLPDLRATTWLYETADRQLRELSIAPMMLSDKESRAIRNKIDLRMTGMAPGSIRAGFKLMPPQADLFDDDTETVTQSMRSRMHRLTQLPEYIREGEIDAMVHELFTDPVELDTTIQVAHDLAPTGRRGIDAVEMSVPGERPARLSPHERNVLRQAIQRPDLENKKHGRFVGEIREFDLDKRRFHLRNIEGVGTLRCVLDETPDKGRVKELIGETVRVEGDYEEDRNGRPRLMLVEDIKIIGQPQQVEVNLT